MRRAVDRAPADGETGVCGSVATADLAFGPCSTFEIWNSLIRLEEGMTGKPDETMWEWDGKMRELPGWNEDQT